MTEVTTATSKLSSTNLPRNGRLVASVFSRSIFEQVVDRLRKSPWKLVLSILLFLPYLLVIFCQWQARLIRQVDQSQG